MKNTFSSVTAVYIHVNTVIRYIKIFTASFIEEQMHTQPNSTDMRSKYFEFVINSDKQFRKYMLNEAVSKRTGILHV